MNAHDAETLSAYLDGQLSAAQARQLESRLASDHGLKSALDDMRLSRRLIGRLPKRRAPHNFTLTPLMKDLTAPEPPAVWGLRSASALATLLFLASFALNRVAPLAPVTLAAAPLPANGFQGGVVGQSTTEQPPQSFAAPLAQAPAGATALSPQDLAMQTPVARAESASREAPSSEGSPARARPPGVPLVPALWQLVLAGAAVLSGVLAWDLQRRTRRQFRSRWLEK
jgi:hypothetical protein